MKRKCDACGRQYEPRTRRSKYCADVDCKRQRERERKRRPAEAPPETEIVLESPGNVFAATLEALTVGGALHTPAGQQALKLATRVDYSGYDTGSALAALGKQHLAALAEALKGVRTQASPLDELRARREARGA